MLNNKILVLAGISSLYDIRSIKEYFEQIGIQTLFIESILMSKYVDEEVEYLACDSFELDKNEDYLFIPLNEYWLTYAYKNKLANISENAYLSSRSKKFFSKMLEQFGIPISKTLSIDEAYKMVSRGKKIIVKPDNYYSGHGVKILDKNNFEKLEFYIQEGMCMTEESKTVLDNMK